ncbi:MAG TPA: hypothetical protein VKF84_09470 [Candidatus Sulfotelmatobacter sp.]|nr:hypothetical protein [Candidatus Sulfotelmatobacter sp.]
MPFPFSDGQVMPWAITNERGGSWKKGGANPMSGYEYYDHDNMKK